jgi:hypothetical protein
VIHIPAPSQDSNAPQITTLSGRDYEILYRFNQREGRWYLTIRSVAGEVIQGPVKIVADWPLIYPGQDLPLPPGTLIAIDTTGQGKDPGLAELGGRVLMFYFDEAETSGAGASA